MCRLSEHHQPKAAAAAAADKLILVSFLSVRERKPDEVEPPLVNVTTRLNDIDIKNRY